MELVRVTSAARGTDEQLSSLERGNILFFPENPFAIDAADRDALLGAGQADGNFHKNIAYRPAKGVVSGLGKTKPGEEARVTAAMQKYSRHAIGFMQEFLARYAGQWHTDYASFRSIEEAGRALPLKKRNDLLHTDAFPTRPTNGGLILRFFTNVNPQKTRDWMTSDPFEGLASRYAMEAGLGEIGNDQGRLKRTALRAAKACGLPLVDRSPYDEFMLGFHDFLKMNQAYQRDCPKFRFHFPAGAAWMVFTDVVPHAVLAGRYALEQTMIVSRESLVNRDHAPATILEKLSGRKLTYKEGD